MDLLVNLLDRLQSTFKSRQAKKKAATLKVLGDRHEASQSCISFVNQFSYPPSIMALKVCPFTSNYYWPKAVAVDDPFIGKLVWICSWHHYSPAYQWRGSTLRAPCRNKEVEEEASAFPPPCRDEPPTGNTKSSARLIMSSTTPQTRPVNQFIQDLYNPYQC